MIQGYSTYSLFQQSLFCWLIFFYFSELSRPSYLRTNGGGGGGVNGVPEWEEPPRFDLRLPENITVAEGQTALLRCRVHHLGNRTVGSEHKIIIYSHNSAIKITIRPRFFIGFITKQNSRIKLLCTYYDISTLAAFVSVPSVFGENIPAAEFGMISAETACWDIERK